MSRAILVMGESGSGKTTSCRNLDPKTTYYIDADRKGLSWRGWRNQYSLEAKNYFQCNNASLIRRLLEKINTEQTHIKCVIIDTINTLMVDDEMARSKEKGYDKWVELTKDMWDLVSDAHLFRDDLTIVVMGHSQDERDDSGYCFTRLKTTGRKLAKIVPESKFTTVLLAKCVDGRYVFETQSRNSTAKSPMGAFDTFEIENDMAQVIEKLSEF